MDLFVVNASDSYRRSTIIEQWEDFIWTDRYSAWGDLQLTVAATQEMNDLLVPNTLISFSESDRLMKIDSTLRTEDADRRQTLQIRGRSIESILDARPAKKVMSSANWDLTGNLGDVVRVMVKTICVDGTGISANDVIAGMTATDSSGETVSQKISIKGGSLYERVKQICDSADLGFRITSTPGSTALPFVVYKGADRSGTTGIVFSEALENLSESTLFTSRENYYSGAYIYAVNGGRTVAADGVSAGVNLNRKILLIDATDITTAAGTDLQTQLEQRARNALSDHRVQRLYDGVVNPTSIYQYNVDYFMGDVVMLNPAYEGAQQMRVTEHIWSGDKTGVTSYPTLSALGGV